MGCCEASALTIFDSSTMIIRRRLVTATSFSRSSAPPRPLTRSSEGRITSSAPSMLRYSVTTSSSSASGIPRRCASPRVRSEVATPVTRSPWRTRSASASSIRSAVVPEPRPIVMPSATSCSTAACAAARFHACRCSSSCVGWSATRPPHRLLVLGLMIPARRHAATHLHQGNLPPASFARRHPRANTPGRDPVVGRFGLQQRKCAVESLVEFTRALLDVDGALFVRNGVEVPLALVWERAAQQIGEHEIRLALLGIALRLLVSISARRQLLSHDIEDCLARLRAIERIERWQGIGRIFSHMHSRPFRHPHPIIATATTERRDDRILCLRLLWAANQ